MNAQRQTARAADAAPVVLACTLSPGAGDYALAAPRDCRFFDGHFPDCPVLPGVAQLRWAIELSAALTGDRAVAGLERIKFMRAITPSDRVQLALRLGDDNRVVAFRYHDGDIGFSSGRLLLEPHRD